jgi:hypothetical protein
MHGRPALGGRWVGERKSGKGAVVAWQRRHLVVMHEAPRHLELVFEQGPR